MRAKFIQVWENLKANFWFVPLLIIVGAIFAAFGLVLLDHYKSFEKPYKQDNLDEFFTYFFFGGIESARSILSTIAGAMLGVAGTVFSLTLVVLTLASSQFGPRLLRNFMLDRLNQVVLGTYVATFIYCLLVLRTTKTIDGKDFVPHFSILFAILITLADIFLLIIFIHHISVSIQADKVVSKVGHNLNANIKKIFSEKLKKDQENSTDPDPEEIKKEYQHQGTIFNKTTGYLQYVDMEQLMQLTTRHQLIIELACQVGEFFVKNAAIANFYAKEKLDEGISNKICSTFIIGKQRTPSQDAEFAIHQMVEIAARALSPGINDPYTAITCIDTLTGTLCYLCEAKFPSPYRHDSDGNLRLIQKPLTFTGMIDAAFHQIRQYGKDNPAVLIHLMESLSTIYKESFTSEQRNAVRRHADMVLRAGESSFSEPNDIEDLKERFNKIHSQ